MRLILSGRGRHFAAPGRSEKIEFIIGVFD